jgi:hypothetical protein
VKLKLTNSGTDSLPGFSFASRSIGAFQSATALRRLHGFGAFFDHSHCFQIVLSMEHAPEPCVSAGRETAADDQALSSMQLFLYQIGRHSLTPG